MKKIEHFFAATILTLIVASGLSACYGLVLLFTGSEVAAATTVCLMLVGLALETIVETVQKLWRSLQRWEPRFVLTAILAGLLGAVIGFTAAVYTIGFIVTAPTP